MNCPHCRSSETKVVDSRTSDSGNSIRRRRECEKCEFRFTTFERLQSVNLIVEKKDGTTEPYDREKLERGVLIACGKRSISVPKIRESINDLEDRWSKEKTILSQKIGADIIEMLREIDDIAFIRFASVYKQFRDVDTFKQELEKLF